MHFLPAGGVMRVDVDALNENLRTHGALRLRHAMRPDEAFGMVLNFDGAPRTGYYYLYALLRCAAARHVCMCVHT